MKNVVISPSDLVYLWSDCRRCFGEKVLSGVRRPGVFDPAYGMADKAMKRAFADVALVDLGVGPKFRVLAQNAWVRSAQVEFDALGVSLTVSGAYDALVETEHGEIFVVDYKTTNADEGALRKFRRQLAAYAFALEHPAQGPSIDVDGHALLAYRPENFAFRTRGLSGLYGRSAWVEIPRDDLAFSTLLTDVAESLARESLPSAPACAFCAYRKRASA